jgi:hypothetical protein
MKIKLFLVMGLLCFLSAQTFALNFMGPPTAELNQGQWSVGYNYSYSVQDLDKTRQNWSLINDGVVTSTGEGQLRIEDLSVQRHYVGINTGFTDWWEIYTRLGFSDVKGDIHWLDVDSKAAYNFDNDFAWGWGTKITFKKSDTIAWGASLHMNWLDTSTSKTEGASGSGPWRDTVRIDTYDTLLAVGPTIDMGGWKLYGGPFYYSLAGDYEHERDFFELNLVEREDARIEEDSSFGVFVGAVVDLNENSDLTAELSFTSDGWALGAGVAKKF